MTKLIHISLLKLSFTRMSLRRAANNNNNIIFNNISTRRERRRIVRDFLSPSMMLFSFSFLLSLFFFFPGVGCQKIREERARDRPRYEPTEIITDYSSPW